MYKRQVFPLRIARDKYELEIKTLHAPDDAVPPEDYELLESAEDQITRAVNNATVVPPEPDKTPGVQIGGASSSKDAPITIENKKK